MMRVTPTHRAITSSVLGAILAIAAGMGIAAGLVYAHEVGRLIGEIFSLMGA
ncbi:MAG: hypothetical protein LW854_15035 [Rubrivivax sp.]|jgi:hypothetical protein|nr:hypothetical protein [Rubrivivax sp.]